MYTLLTETIDLGDGRNIVIETGKLAKQADGSVVVRMGNTMLLATVVSARDINPETDFMPLSVDYKEKFSAVGRFPGGFLKREGRLSDYEILVSRLIDRALRPLFPKDYHAETFVTVTLISADADTIPDALAGLAASAAIAVSDVPIEAPISEVRVGRVDGKFIVNPTASQLLQSDIDIMVGGTVDNILMIEGEMSEVSEADMLEAIKVAHAAIKPHCEAQLRLAEKAGKTVKRTYSVGLVDEELEKQIHAFCYQKLYDITAAGITNKHERGDKFSEVKAEFIASLPTEPAPNTKLIGRYFHDVERDAVRNYVLDSKIRLDGRKTDQIRPIWSEIDALPAAHGSAIFTRGETQSLTSVTLGTKLDEKIVDDVMFQGTERFMLHYNFPPFSTGEAKPSRGVSRREVGHGNLAHRALKRMIPAAPENPYVLRVVSDILESNGSSSMATVCAGSLALMDAGIKLKKPVSGIAMGMISDAGAKRYAILSDILGEEDHLGDMDFKVCGTADGITACQMDMKIDGLSYELMATALEQARQGRMHILGKIAETMPAPRADYKPHTPRIEKVIIDKDQIGAVIGSGGKVIQEIQRRTGTVITISEVGNTGEVEIFATSRESIEKARTIIKTITTEPEVGAIYTGVVKTIVAFGAFVELVPGVDGMVHISEIDHRRLETVDEVLKVGDEVTVTVLGMDKGKIKLSRKALLPKPESNQPPREPKQLEKKH